MQTTISAKGQITVPKAVRDELHLRAGDKVQFFVEPDGAVRFAPVTRSVASLKSLLPKPAKTLSLSAMDAAIARGAARQ